MESHVNVKSHLLNDANDSMCGFDGFTKRLSDANSRLTAIIHVLLVSFTTAVLVNVPTMKHSLREGLVVIRQILCDIDIKKLTHVTLNRLKIMEARLF